MIKFLDLIKSVKLSQVYKLEVMHSCSICNSGGFLIISFLIFERPIFNFLNNDKCDMYAEAVYSGTLLALPLLVQSA